MSVFIVKIMFIIYASKQFFCSMEMAQNIVYSDHLSLILHHISLLTF